MINISVPYIGTNQKRYIDQCFNENYYSHRGPFIKLFEEAMASYLKVDHVIAVANGSVSLNAIYHCMGFKNKRVATNVLSYAATAMQLELVGAEPVYVDCDDDLQMDLVKLEELMETEKIDAVVVAELYGIIPNIQWLMDICDRYKVPLIEDSAECLGHKDLYYQKFAGTYGVASSFSMFANKTIQCGEGGFIATNDKALAIDMRLFTHQGQGLRYDHTMSPATNYRLTNIQAAIALAQLEDIEYIQARKAHIACRYRREITTAHMIDCPTGNGWWLQAFWLKKGAYLDFEKYMTAKDIEVRPVFRPMCSIMANKGRYNEADFPVATEAHKRCFSLPNFVALTDDQINYIVGAVNSYVSKS